MCPRIGSAPRFASRSRCPGAFCRLTAMVRPADPSPRRAVMRRRTFLGKAMAIAAASPLSAALQRQRWDDAAEVLDRAVAVKQVDSAVLHVAQRGESYTRHFGKAASDHAMFLLGSISKPISVAAIMTLFDQGRFQLDDRVK